MIKKIASLVFISFLLSDCKKDPFVSKDVIDDIRALQHTSVSNVGFIYNNDIYFLADFSGTATQITNTPGITKRKLRMSHNHRKFAYLNSSSVIEIADLNGAVTNLLSQYPNATDFDWAADDTTLYILYNNQLQFFGPSFTTPSITYPNIPITSTRNVLSLSLSANNDLAYVIEFFDFTNGYQYEMVRKPNDGTGSFVVTNDNDPFLKMSYVRFSNHAQDLALGYEDISGNSGMFSKLELFDDLVSYPHYSFESSELYFTPTYRSDLHHLVSGMLEFSNNQIVLAKRDLATIPDGDVFLNNYNNATSSLYVDWK